MPSPTRLVWPALALGRGVCRLDRLDLRRRAVADPRCRSPGARGRSARWHWIRARHEGRAFAATAIAIGGTVAALFANLYPNVMVSSTSTANNLTVSGTASGDYALKVMTVVAVVIFPVVLLYQGWSYWVFRHRIAAPPERSHDPGDGTRVGGCGSEQQRGEPLPAAASSPVSGDACGRSNRCDGPDRAARTKHGWHCMPGAV